MIKILKLNAKNCCFFIAIFLCVNFQKVAAQTTHLEFEISGWNVSQATLGYHFGGQYFAIDSTNFDTVSGKISFHFPKKLPTGLYFLGNTGGGILFDFLMTNDTFLRIKTAANMPYDSAKIEEKSEENRIWFGYQRTSRLVSQQIETLKATESLIRQATTDTAVWNEHQRKMRDAQAQLDAYSHAQISIHANTFAAKILNTTLPLEVPADIAPKTADGRAWNPVYLHYLRQHFLDNIDFSDENLLRTPYFTVRLQQFLTRIIPSQPDSVRHYLDLLLARGRVQTKPVVYQFMLQWLTNLFDTNLETIVNGDAYLLHLVEKYHHEPDSPTEKTTLERLDYKAKSFKSNLLGSVATDIFLPDSSGKMCRLSEQSNRYTLVIFYSSLCDHCRETLPKVKDLLTNYPNVSVFTVNNDGFNVPCIEFLKTLNAPNWVNVLDESAEKSAIQSKYPSFQFPSFYLLDDQKRIISKWFKFDGLQKILLTLR
jgi:thiol-disulfide isomerase/thioredoxin